MEIINMDYLHKSSSKNFVNKNKLAPQHIFRCGLIGSSGGGKSNMLGNLLTKYLYFDKLYVYSRHLEQDIYTGLRNFFESAQKKIMKQLKIKEDCEEYDEEYERIKIYHEDNDVKNIIPLEEINENLHNIVVFDDMNFEKNQNVMIEYFSSGRHKNCSCFYLAQSFFDIPKAIRLNCNYFCIFNTPSTTNLDLIRKTIALDIDKDKLKEIFKNVLSKPYNFVTFDLKTNIGPLRIRKNWDSLLKFK